MNHYPHPIIAREGWSFIVISLVVTVVAGYVLPWLFFPCGLICLFVIQFFRDPPRTIPEDPSAILSPADGRVVLVENTEDPYRHIESLKISVFMNVFNVHSNRSPMEGMVEDVQYYAGSFVNAALAKASTENERNAVMMTTTRGQSITFVQVAGLVARRIICYVKTGDQLKRGQRYGFIRFGSRVDIYLPKTVVVCVSIGDKVRATETILAKI